MGNTNIHEPLNIMCASDEDKSVFMHEACKSITRLRAYGSQVPSYDNNVFYESNIQDTSRFLAGLIKDLGSGVLEIFVCLCDEADLDFQQICIFYVNKEIERGVIKAASDDVRDLWDAFGIYKQQFMKLIYASEFNVERG